MGNTGLHIHRKGMGERYAVSWHSWHLGHEQGNAGSGPKKRDGGGCEECGRREAQPHQLLGEVPGVEQGPTRTCTAATAGVPTYTQGGGGTGVRKWSKKADQCKCK